MAGRWRCRELHERAAAASRLPRPAMTASNTDAGELRFGKIQLHADTIRIVEKDLRISGTGHNALAEFHVLRLKALANTFDISRGEGDVVEASGIVVFFLRATHHDAFARLARAHQVYRGNTAGIEPVARKIERRTFAVLQSQHIAIEILGALQIGWLNREMLQSTKRHFLLLRPKVRSVSGPMIQAPPELQAATANSRSICSIDLPLVSIPRK